MTNPATDSGPVLAENDGTSRGLDWLLQPDLHTVDHAGLRRSSSAPSDLPDPERGPYKQAALEYLWTGMGGPLPLPSRKKKPPPAGWTGGGAPYPSGADVCEWIEAQPQANIGLRLAEDVIGIDVDAYDGKEGGVTFARLQELHGQLPPTVRSTSRTDGVSGVRLYRVPVGMHWRGVLCVEQADGRVTGDIEVIHQGYRFVVCWPSLHPENRRYEWLDADGRVLDWLPYRDELPVLPPAWVPIVLPGRDTDDGPGMPDEQVGQWLTALPDGDPCPLVAQARKQILAAVTGEHRHDNVRDGVLRLLTAGARGHRGVPEALRQSKDAFTEAVTAPVRHQGSTDRGGVRGISTADGEWTRMVIGGVRLISSEKLGRDEPSVNQAGCGCPPLGTSKTASTTRRGIAAPDATNGLADVHKVFRRWLGSHFDLGALDAVLAAAAVQKLDGDPVWLLLVGGSGSGKTEIVMALQGCEHVIVTSTIQSEGALLSGTAHKEKAAGASGGLLHRLGPAGLLVLPDFTSVISMSREPRATVLAALREVYDGRWERNLGIDGGRSLRWEGRITVIGATTTAWDQAHTIVASMGDRFALVRIDSASGRHEAGAQAMENLGNEREMRADLAVAVRGLLNEIDRRPAVLDPSEKAILLSAADFVTRARTAVEHDISGAPSQAHDLEMPTRLAKMLVQVVRGSLALGAERPHAVAIALRIARDSIPPRRLKILMDLLTHDGSSVDQITARLTESRTTVDRATKELRMLGLVTSQDGKTYRLCPEVDQGTLRALINQQQHRG
jgi:biotin operon repressor